MLTLILKNQRCDSEDWDPDKLTAKKHRHWELLSNNRELLHNDLKMKLLAENCRSRNTGAKITTVYDLLKQYYADVRFLAVPEGGKDPVRACTQLDRLYHEIRSLNANASTRNLPYDKLVPHLDHAFDNLAVKLFIDAGYPIPGPTGSRKQRKRVSPRY